MTSDAEAGREDPAVANALWPDIAVRFEVGGVVPRWRASSVHPELGPISGRGISHEAAVRSLVRGIRRRRFMPADADPSAPVDALARGLLPEGGAP